MKQSPEMNKIQENLQPGSISAAGFLGEDTRNLSEIIDQDNKDLEAIGLANSDIADRMEYFTDIAIKNLGNELIIDDKYLVSVDDHRGKVPCPFKDAFKAAKRNTKFTNIELDITVYWSDLNIHMIRHHGFYEGRGSFFRIEAKEIGKILGSIE